MQFELETSDENRQAEIDLTMRQAIDAKFVSVSTIASLPTR